MHIRSYMSSVIGALLMFDDNDDDDDDEFDEILEMIALVLGTVD